MVRKKKGGKKIHAHAGASPVSGGEEHENEIDPNACRFCLTDNDDEKRYGKFLRKDGVVTHYFCMLFSSGLGQNGKTEEDGIYGFLPKDIRREISRGNRFKCVYCKIRGATIGCCNKSCRLVFHYNCGQQNGALYQFFGNFSSYCGVHRLKQSSPTSDRLSFHGTANTTCAICMCSVVARASNDTLRTPCCKNSWYHRDCIQSQAMSAGLHFFKCPLCNNKELFQDEMLKFGIYIPDQDAAWEREENAFQELLQRHSRCDAPKCLSNRGRTFATRGKYFIVLCDMCGSQGTHLCCSNLKDSDSDWVCRECRKVQKQLKTKTPVSNKAKVPKASALADSWMDKGKSSYKPSTAFPTKRGMKRKLSSSEGCPWAKKCKLRECSIQLVDIRHRMNAGKVLGRKCTVSPCGKSVLLHAEEPSQRTMSKIDMVRFQRKLEAMRRGRLGYESEKEDDSDDCVITTPLSGTRIETDTFRRKIQNLKHISEMMSTPSEKNLSGQSVFRDQSDLTNTVKSFHTSGSGRNSSSPEFFCTSPFPRKSSILATPISMPVSPKSTCTVSFADRSSASSKNRFSTSPSFSRHETPLVSSPPAYIRDTRETPQLTAASCGTPKTFSARKSSNSQNSYLASPNLSPKSSKLHTFKSDAPQLTASSCGTPQTFSSPTSAQVSRKNIASYWGQSRAWGMIGHSRSSSPESASEPTVSITGRARRNSQFQVISTDDVGYSPRSENRTPQVEVSSGHTQIIKSNCYSESKAYSGPSPLKEEKLTWSQHVKPLRRGMVQQHVRTSPRPLAKRLDFIDELDRSQNPRRSLVIPGTPIDLANSDEDSGKDTSLPLRLYPSQVPLSKPEFDRLWAPSSSSSGSETESPSSKRTAHKLKNKNWFYLPKGERKVAKRAFVPHSQQGLRSCSVVKPSMGVNLRRRHTGSPFRPMPSSSSGKQAPGSFENADDFSFKTTNAHSRDFSQDPSTSCKSPARDGAISSSPPWRLHLETTEASSDFSSPDIPKHTTGMQKAGSSNQTSALQPEYISLDTFAGHNLSDNPFSFPVRRKNTARKSFRASVVPLRQKESPSHEIVSSTSCSPPSLSPVKPILSKRSSRSSTSKSRSPFCISPVLFDSTDTEDEGTSSEALPILSPIKRAYFSDTLKDVKTFPSSETKSFTAEKDNQKFVPVPNRPLVSSLIDSGSQTRGSSGRETIGSSGLQSMGSIVPQTVGSSGPPSSSSSGLLTMGSSGLQTFGSSGRQTMGSSGLLTTGSSGALSVGSSGPHTTGSTSDKSLVVIDSDDEDDVVPSTTQSRPPPPPVQPVIRMPLPSKPAPSNSVVDLTEDDDDDVVCTAVKGTVAPFSRVATHGLPSLIKLEKSMKVFRGPGNKLLVPVHNLQGRRDKDIDALSIGSNSSDNSVKIQAVIPPRKPATEKSGMSNSQSMPSNEVMSHRPTDPKSLSPGRPVGRIRPMMSQ